MKEFLNLMITFFPFTFESHWQDCKEIFLKTGFVLRLNLS